MGMSYKIADFTKFFIKHLFVETNVLFTRIWETVFQLQIRSSIQFLTESFVKYECIGNDQPSENKSETFTLW